MARNPYRRYEVTEYQKEALKFLQPPEDITVSEWADKYRVLDAKTSAMPGPWRTEHTPYLKGIMDEFNNYETEEIVYVKPTQVGGTECLQNMVGYIVQQDPAPTMIVYPTDTLAKSISENRLQPMFKAAPELRKRFDENSQLQELQFDGMYLTLAGSNSPSSLASKAIRFLFLDEVDKYPGASKKEADPVSLARERTKTFHNRKIFITSTPTLKTGHIWKAKEDADIEKHYFVPCPHCGEYIELKWKQIHFPSITESAEDKFRAAAADAIVMRSGMELQNPADGARQMMGMTLRDLAIECLTNEGQSGLNRRSSDELYGMLQRQFYNPTAAFPAILDNAINKAYVEGHKTVAVTFDQWTKKGTLKDFKTHDNNYLAGPVGEFLEVPEGGELKHDVFGDEKLPTRKLKTYGRQFTLTRQAFINDDIDLLTRVPAKYAASARKTQNKQCYQILVNNPAIYDGTALFSSAHSNLLAKGTGITKEAVQGMILALQNQTDQFGEATIIRPAIIIVPSGYMFDMYTLFYSPTISTSGNTQAVNPLYRYKDSITVVEDPTINALCGGFGNVMPWWLLGAKDDTDFIEVDYLNGQEIPTIRRMETPGTLGFVWDIYLDWGISVMDYRGAIKNPGIEVKNPIELA